MSDHEELELVFRKGDPRYCTHSTYTLSGQVNLFILVHLLVSHVFITALNVPRTLAAPLPSGCFRGDGDGVVSVDDVSSAESDDEVVVTVIIDGSAVQTTKYLLANRMLLTVLCVDQTIDLQ